MKKGILSEGEIEIGMFITIHSNKPDEREDAFGNVVTVARIDHSWHGDVLRVKAIQLPYIVVDDVNRACFRGIDLDVRRYVFMELSQEYIDAVSTKATP